MERINEGLWKCLSRTCGNIASKKEIIVSVLNMKIVSLINISKKTSLSLDDGFSKKIVKSMRECAGLPPVCAEEVISRLKLWTSRQFAEKIPILTSEDGAVTLEKDRKLGTYVFSFVPAKTIDMLQEWPPL